METINRIKGALADAHRTNRWLADKLGKDETTVSKWCSNKSQPSLETLMRIAECLNPSLTLENFFKKIFQRGEIVSG